MVTPSTRYEVEKVDGELACPICSRFLVWEAGLKYGCYECGARFLANLVEKDKVLLLRLLDKCMIIKERER